MGPFGKIEGLEILMPCYFTQKKHASTLAVPVRQRTKHTAKIIKTFFAVHNNNVVK
ncbi:unnamed protein product [Acanthoscelides obtectus]|uniref:Uncharacterized protein n=1 Tax=Acanthoscelides obtectus TaxID=200917 RepID=A0A9P0KL40_ACAOB|nr:unnamed protein product [Acanthoscelides obtectus]CAK1674858.1 hypothetical protein AOBTE_LOCUS29779 [Acanthoscelides obtectus]